MLRMMITSRQSAGGEEPLLRAVRRAADERVDFVQIREKDLEARALASLTRAILAAATSSATNSAPKVLVNARPDVALACGAHGAHLPGYAPPPSLWSRAVPPGFLFSVACHSLEDALRAEAEGAHLLLFAPVFDPLSKPSTGPPAGLAALREVCLRVRIPVFALGGITPARIPACLDAGAAGFAAISFFL
jgi:thiamine-phosphate pyrophosphorylase